MESLFLSRENFLNMPKPMVCFFFSKGKAYQVFLGFFFSILSKILRALYVNANQIRFARDIVFSELPTCEPDFHIVFLMSRAAADLQNLRIANTINHQAFGKLLGRLCLVRLGFVLDMDTIKNQ